MKFILIPFLLIFTHLSSASTNRVQALAAMGASGEKIEQALNSYEAGGDYRLLSSAQHFLDSYTSKNPEADEAALQIELEILRHSILAKDTNFNSQTAPAPVIFNVMVPKEIGSNVLSQVAAARAENDAWSDYYNKQITLEKIHRRSLGSARVRLYAIMRRDRSKQKAAESLILRIPDHQTQQALFSSLTNWPGSSAL